MTRAAETGAKHAAGRGSAGSVGRGSADVAGRGSAGAAGRGAESERSARSRRRLEVVGLAIGLLIGLGFALTQLPSRAPGRPAGPEPTSTARPLVVPAASSAEPDPTALDSEWAGYSDRSTCADWAGGDGISAFRLSPAQLAWFFSDTFLGPAGPSIGFSHLSGFVHNSVVVQTSSGASGSTFVTMTGGGACPGPGRAPGRVTFSVVGPPSAPGAAADRYWDADGIELGGTIVKFYNRYLPGDAPFVPTGTVIASFPASQLSALGHGSAYGQVTTPSLVPLPAYTPSDGGTPIVWGAALLRTGNTIYVYGTQTADPSLPDRQLYLARVAAPELTRFSAWQFYTGDGQWAASQQDVQPLESPGGAPGVPVASGFSVVEIRHRFWLIQADPQAGSQDIDAFPAATPWGPFDPSSGLVLYQNPDVGLDAAHDYRIMYEARVEPALSTSHTLVISYNVNSEAVSTGCVPISALTNTVTQPRFIAVPLAAFAPNGGPSLHPARSGPSDYPSIVQRDPTQWFNSWSYRGGCPPVPALPALQARPAPRSVTLTWPDLGLGIHYQVYLQAPGDPAYRLVKSIRSTSVTITGLQPATYQARVVPLNSRQTPGSPVQTIFTVRKS
jgi:hypothetical protein